MKKKIAKLETERLILRKPRKEDWKQIYKNVDKTIIENFMLPNPYTPEHTKKFLSNWIKEWGSKSYWFVVELKETHEIIGTCGIREIDKSRLSAQSHFLMGKKYREKGYAIEAMIAVNEFFFNKLKFRKLKAEVMKTNIPSNKIQLKFSYTFKGTTKKAYFNPTLKEFVDMNNYELSKLEWKKVLPRLKKDLKKRV